MWDMFVPCFGVAFAKRLFSTVRTGRTGEAFTRRVLITLRYKLQKSPVLKAGKWVTFTRSDVSCF